MLTFSASEVKRFVHNNKAKRWGQDFYDFMIRCYGKSVNKRVVASLIECGAFDIFNINNIYKFYGLTQEEIDYIESQVK